MSEETTEGLSVEAKAELRLWRKRLRAQLLQTRAALADKEREEKNNLILERIKENFLEKLSCSLVGIYWPIRGEVDVRPLVELIRRGGGTAALPVVVGKAQPLVFRVWREGDTLRKGAYEIPEPEHGPAVEPDILFVPPLGFDADCYRLGYGGGFYDRTLQAVQKKPLTIGVAFEVARLDSIRPQSYDKPLDYVMTELVLQQQCH